MWQIIKYSDFTPTFLKKNQIRTLSILRRMKYSSTIYHLPSSQFISNTNQYFGLHISIKQSNGFNCTYTIESRAVCLNPGKVLSFKSC